MNKQERIKKMIDRLRGSTISMATECEDLDLDDMDNEVTEAVDAEVFECSTCGWWCDQDEEASDEHGLDEWTCSDCCLEK